MTKIISISVSDADKEFLELMELSPSGLFKQKVAEVREISFNYNEKLKVRENAIMRLNEEISKLNAIIEKHGIVLE